MSKLWLPYPNDKEERKEYRFNLEVARTVATFATLLCCISNLVVLTYAVKVVAPSLNSITSQVEVDK